jgi:hypothetical protein
MQQHQQRQQQQQQQRRWLGMAAMGTAITAGAAPAATAGRHLCHTVQGLGLEQRAAPCDGLRCQPDSKGSSSSSCAVRTTPAQHGSSSSHSMKGDGGWPLQRSQ